MSAASDRLKQFIAEDRLIRGTWTSGAERACLLASMVPAVQLDHQVSSCPAEVMPAWLAHLTPWIDDAGTLKAWPTMVRRYAELAGRWHVLDAAAWQRLDYASRAAAVQEAMKHTQDRQALAACSAVASLCLSVAAGSKIDPKQFAAARAAAADADAAAAADADAAARAAAAAA